MYTLRYLQAAVLVLCTSYDKQYRYTYCIMLCTIIVFDTYMYSIRYNLQFMYNIKYILEYILTVHLIPGVEHPTVHIRYKHGAPYYMLAT